MQSGLASASDIKHMHELASMRGGAMRMDLSDPSQYRFLLSRVVASGKNRQNSPQFFAMIDRMKQRHTSRKPSPDVVVALNGKPKDHLLGSVVRLTDGVNFRATTFATIQDGADYNFVDGVVWDEAGNTQISDYGWGEEYGDGRKLVAQATGPAGSTATTFIKVDSMNLVAVDGVEESFYFLEDTKIPAAAAGGQLIHPRDNNADNIVTICLNRGSGDCDYPLVGEWVVKFPLKGHIIFPFPVVEVINDPGTSVKVVELNGGPKELIYGSTPFSKRFVIDPTDKRKVSWDVPQADGQFNGLLFQAYQDVDFFQSVKVKMARGTTFTTVTAKISSIDAGPNVSTNDMPKAKLMQLSYGCLAKGTKIQLANGKVANVEDIGRSTLVKSDGSGLELPVSDISIGAERIPMVRIADSAGHSLLLTDSHPVMTPDKGAVWAKELTVGSKVLTEKGVSTLVKVSSEMYTDNVYNLKLDRSQLKTEAKGSTMYANGFLVGDLAMQRAYEVKNAKDLSADVMSRLPASWHTDYLNSVKVASR